MNFEQIISAANVLVVPAFSLLMGVVVWFVRRTMEHIDKISETTQAMTTATKLLEQRLETIQRDVAAALLLAPRLAEFESKLTILERNQMTVFAKLDDLRDNGDLLRRRSHHFQNKLLVLKAALEAMGDDDLGNDWGMPT